MKIEEIKIKVSELLEGFVDNGDDGVYGYDDGNHKLTIRPSFQREFIYSPKEQRAVIDTVLKEYPLNTMYWSKISDTEFEVLDGQQRTLSLANFKTGNLTIKINGNDKFYHNLTEDQKKIFDNYELSIYICDGTESEKLEWFKVINIAGETLTDQELLNAVYAGPWLQNAKKYFSRKGCPAVDTMTGYMKGNAQRQEYLEKTLKWIADRDGLKDGESYMAAHQQDADAEDLWAYFQEVRDWAKRLFPEKISKITDTQDWGVLYNKYKDKKYNAKDLDKDVRKLMMDDDVTDKSGIIPYLLSDKTSLDESSLHIRAFTDTQKLNAWERQGHKCPLCQGDGIETEYELSEMEGDHIIPWSKGGKTDDANLQMLCKKHNRNKSDK